MYKRQGLSGAGYYIPGLNLGKSFSLGFYSTVYQSEVYALLQCCVELIGRNCFGGEIVIFCDSQAVLKSFSSLYIKSALIFRCLSMLNELSISNNVQLCWIPGHQGCPGNDEADRLARVGSSSPLSGPEPALELARP